MKTRYLRHLTVAAAVAALIPSTITLRADLEDRIDKRFEVAPGGTLVLEADRGKVEVTSGDKSEVVIEVLREASWSSRSREERLLRDHRVTFAQKGDRIEIKAKFAREPRRGWFSRGPQLRVEYRIQVPRHFNLELDTAGGSIAVTGLEGTVRAQTAGGSLRFEEIEGPIRGRTAGGSITANDCRSDADLHTSGGSITLENLVGDVQGHTSGGSIRADSITGRADLRSTGGSIKLENCSGPLAATTSGGSVTAAFDAAPNKEAILKTSGGSITVELPESAAITLDAHTTGGRVYSDLPVTLTVRGEQRKNELKGDVNGGGPLVTAHTTGGSVHLKAR